MIDINQELTSSLASQGRRYLVVLQDYAEA